MVMNCPGYSKEFDPTAIFQRILVPVDFTPESRRALITACEARSRFGSEIHVFLARGSGGNSEFLASLGAACTKQDIEASARAQLDHFAQSICNATPCLYTAAHFGDDVVEGIAAAAAACDATIVFLAPHHDRGLFRTRAEKIIRALDLPVLLLKGTKAPVLAT